MSQERAGAIYGAAAYTLWGLLPLYWLLVDEAGSVEVVAHRLVWSLVVVLAILAVRRRIARVWSLGWRSVGLLAVAAVVITINWCVYIWAVTTSQVIEMSLGYFINPLVTVLIGVIVIRERLRPAQWVAMGVAATAVLVLTIDYGRLPWIALTLAFTFATYGLAKKKAAMGAAEGLAVETAILLVPSVAFLVWLEVNDTASFGHSGWELDLFLVGCGLVTAVPLMLFSAAATRVPLTTLGLLQYLAPTLGFILGVTVFDEDVPPVRLAGFALVWVALVIFTADALRRRRRLRLQATSLVA